MLFSRALNPFSILCCILVMLEAELSTSGVLLKADKFQYKSLISSRRTGKGSQIYDAAPFLLSIIIERISSKSSALPEPSWIFRT